jgi:hypothetical protein
MDEKQAANAPKLDDAPAPSAQKIVEEFQYLLEKSQQLFAGLRYSSGIYADDMLIGVTFRDIPQNAGSKLWHPYFQRTFEVYTKVSK